MSVFQTSLLNNENVDSFCRNRQLLFDDISYQAKWFSAHNLGRMFYEHLNFSDQVSALTISCSHTFDNFAASVGTLISKQPILSQSILCTPSLTTATHFTIIYQTSHYKQENSGRVEGGSVDSDITGSSHITPALKSLHGLKIKKRINMINN